MKSAVHQGEDPVQMPDAIGDQVISRQAADSVTSVLTGVVDDGTAQGSVRNAEGLADQDIAGKTGTSDDNKSAWFTGYTPTSSPRSACSEKRPTRVPTTTARRSRRVRR